jgi:hypothetical protein
MAGMLGTITAVVLRAVSSCCKECNAMGLHDTVVVGPTCSTIVADKALGAVAAMGNASVPFALGVAA